MSMAELENIRDHVAYLHGTVPRSEWTRDDQWIVHLSAKIDAVLQVLDESHEGQPLEVHALRARIRRALEAGNA